MEESSQVNLELNPVMLGNKFPIYYWIIIAVSVVILIAIIIFATRKKDTGTSTTTSIQKKNYRWRRGIY